MLFKNIIFALLLIQPLFSDQPWGKDVDLIYFRTDKPQMEEIRLPSRQDRPLQTIFNEIEPIVEKPNNIQKISPSPLRRTAEGLIWIHQNFISEADGPRSHYIPSSSQYTLEAIRKYGFFKGWILGCDRLMRENKDDWVYTKTQGPYCMLKYDPVP